MCVLEELETSFEKGDKLIRANFHNMSRQSIWPRFLFGPIREKPLTTSLSISVTVLVLCDEYIYLSHIYNKVAPYILLSTCVIHIFSGLIKYCFYIGVI